MFKVIETFSGIGSQTQALKNIGVKHEIVNTVEWDIKAMIAYALIHHGSLDINQYDRLTNEDVDKKIEKYNSKLSYDGKSLIKEKSLGRLSYPLKKLILAAIAKTNNLVSIVKVEGEQIPDDIDLLTYSFPCQDLSLAGYWHGNKSGIARDAENRSGMLWEIERILSEMCEANKSLPKFLLMENVPNILSKPYEKDFTSWKTNLEKMGYFNVIYSLNARDFGIPQRRKRVYMISVLAKNEKQKKDVEDYFNKHNLEKNKLEVVRLATKKTKLEDIIKIDYSEKDYKEEAEACRPNNTKSRQKIYKNNKIIYDEKKLLVHDVSTVTTKQDRNPNSGLVVDRKEDDEKTKFRYLTPRECFLLMGFEEKDYEILLKNNICINKSNKLFSVAKLNTLAGNSIVVNVLEAIFKQVIEVHEGIFGNKVEKEKTNQKWQIEPIYEGEKEKFKFQS